MVAPAARRGDRGRARGAGRRACRWCAARRADAPDEAVWPENGDGEPAVLLRARARRDRRRRHHRRPRRSERFATRGQRAAPVGARPDRAWARRAGGAPTRGRWQPLRARRRHRRRARRATGSCRAARRPSCASSSRRIERPTRRRHVAWAPARFEMGCERGSEAEALSDYLLGLRALLDATSDAGRGQPGPARGGAVRRGGPAPAGAAPDRGWLGAGAVRDGRRARGPGRTADSPRELVEEVERHLRALLRDVLCGYLDSDLGGVADDILLETNPEPFMEIEARDLRASSGGRRRARAPPEPEPDPRPTGAGCRGRPSPRPRPGHRRDGAGVEGTAAASWRASPSPPTGASGARGLLRAPVGPEQVLVHRAQARRGRARRPRGAAPRSSACGPAGAQQVEVGLVALGQPARSS